MNLYKYAYLSVWGIQDYVLCYATMNTECDVKLNLNEEILQLHIMKEKVQHRIICDVEKVKVFGNKK